MATQLTNLGELDAIARFRAWQYFGTLTFSGVEPSLCLSTKLAFAHFYRCARLLRVPFGLLVWALRVERGEIGGRLHYHCLIGGGRRTPNKGLCFALNQLWDCMPRCGHARHRLFDQKQNGTSYVSSCLANHNTAGADFYESQKFGDRGSDLTLSDSLLEAVGGRRVLCARMGLVGTAGKSVAIGDRK